jgi:hypothetical protein
MKLFSGSNASLIQARTVLNDIFSRRTQPSRVLQMFVLGQSEVDAAVARKPFPPPPFLLLHSHLRKSVLQDRR